MIGKKKILVFILVIAGLATAMAKREKPDKRSGMVRLEDRFDKKTQGYAFTLPNMAPVPGVNALLAVECGECHEDIYNEWKKSTHAYALRDIQFQAELAKADSPKWLCLNCHIPVGNQRKKQVTGFRDNNILDPVSVTNPEFDSIMRTEAITCATCHVRWDADKKHTHIVGPHENPGAPHPVKKNPEFLHAICARCHDPRGEPLTENLLCWFTTMAENKDAQQDIMKQFGRERDCVDCHMPLQTRGGVIKKKDGRSRDVHRHLWTGSGIPKTYAGYTNLLERAYRSALGVEVQNRGTLDKPIFWIILENKRAGHDLPTGDPERFIRIIAKVVSGEGRTLSMDTLRIGQVWKWNPARRISDNRLKRGERRAWKPEMLIPDKIPKGRFIVRAWSVRMTGENAGYLMKTQGINEEDIPDGQKQVRHAIDYYPFATAVFEQKIELSTGESITRSPKELLDISMNEKGKPVGSREY